MPMGVITSVCWLLHFFLNNHQVGGFILGEFFLRIKQVININIKNWMLSKLSNNQLRTIGQRAGYTLVI
jgi:hypothetical protein